MWPNCAATHKRRMTRRGLWVVVLAIIAGAMHALRLPSRSLVMAAAAASGGGSGAAGSKAWRYDPKKIRNFSIIAHIDHGKSTLADRLLEATRTIEARQMQDQVLDNLAIERERGITIKLRAARMLYTAQDKETYLLNLIDTPGHVDFGFEVARSLAACDGALLVVDASQGVQAQTMANVYQALDNNLQVIPVINKIDLPAADPDRICHEIESIIGLDCSEAVRVSAKSGQGVDALLEAVVRNLPPPSVPTDGPPLADRPLRARVFDSYYDPYRGVVALFRVVEGRVARGDKIRFLRNPQTVREVLEIGVLTPEEHPVDALAAGEVGYLCAGVKALEDVAAGETIAQAADQAPLGECRPPRPMVFCGLYPSDPDDLEAARDALTKLKLNDAAFTFAPERSDALGLGFRCGFLGMLHMEIVQERLESEYDLDLVTTAPSVVYRAALRSGEVVEIDAPSKLPDVAEIDQLLEPFALLEVIGPAEATGALMELAKARRAQFREMRYLSPDRCMLVYEAPMAEVITDFVDEVKSRSKGYASMSVTELDYRAGDLVRLDIHIHHEMAPPLSSIVPRERAFVVGKAICNKLKELIPRQQFRIPVQACIGAKVVASAHISAVMKDVLAKCYGGDVSRKKKLLQKQARGKKRMRELGSVQVPQEAFMAVVRYKQDD